MRSSIDVAAHAPQGTEAALLEKLETLSLIRVLHERLAQAPDFPAACQVLTDLVWDERPVEAVALLTIDHERAVARVEAATPAHGAGPRDIPLAHGPLRGLLDQPEPVMLFDCEPPTWVADAAPGTRGVLLAAPLRLRGRTRALLLVFTTGAASAIEEDRRLLGIVAPAAAPALDVARTTAREEFLALLRHDVSTPLSVALGYTELLAEQLADRHDPTLEPMAASILGSLRTVGDLVANYLDLAAIDRGVPWLVPGAFDLHQLVAEIVARYLLPAQDKQLQLTYEGTPMPMEGDPRQLGRVVGNLVSNAIKYTPGPGAVRVRLAAPADAAVLTVEDTGLGIAAGDLPRVFTRGARLHRGLDIPGTGLGLFLSKAIVEAHRGTIGVASAVDLGSTFTVHLPRR